VYQLKRLSGKSIPNIFWKFHFTGKGKRPGEAEGKSVGLGELLCWRKCNLFASLCV
jgi:hypothetical protein